MMRQDMYSSAKFKTQNSESRTQHLRSGFALPTAIFLIVVLAALGAFIVSITSLSQSSSAIDIQGVRAYQAARAGIEWAIYQVVDPNNALGTNLANCPASPTTFATGSLGGTLAGFTVSVTCNAVTAYTEGSITRKVGVYQITSTATIGTVNMPTYSNRQISVTVSKCKDSTAAAPQFSCS